MIEIKEYDKEVLILGYKEVKIDSVNNFVNSLKQKLPGLSFQVFDAEYVAGRSHLFFAALNALKAFKQGRNISDNIEMETLLYASGLRQIKKAIETLGLQPTTTKLAILIFLSGEAAEIEEKISNVILAKRDDHVLDVYNEKIEKLMKTFHIEVFELETIAKNADTLSDAIIKAIIERISLLAIHG